MLRVIFHTGQMRYCNIWSTHRLLLWITKDPCCFKANILRFSVSNEFAIEAHLIFCIVHIGTVSSQFFHHYDIRIAYTITFSAGWISLDVWAVVFHPHLLINKAMKLTLHCIFSHINSIDTIKSPMLARAILKIIILTSILFTNGEKDGVLHPFGSQCKLKMKYSTFLH